MDGKKAVFEITATGLREGEIEGVIFNLAIPTEQFAGGSLMVEGKELELPGELLQISPSPQRTLWTVRRIRTHRAH